jgi:hypothetical protein
MTNKVVLGAVVIIASIGLTLGLDHSCSRRSVEEKPRPVALEPLQTHRIRFSDVEKIAREDSYTIKESHDPHSRGYPQAILVGIEYSEQAYV